ncbi:NADPH-dependent 2,4-dienoyl-CoA reductase [Corynebacterium pseudodiphtheriticum]|uniref:NADPH-dependent 2,4-dienoyl-CoA reductase n=1 Tax=Corynebacterium pseudodiphtheriticum TaxID=37637 RepID=UPI0020C18106|nr:NADPH-dependent 2,4-dienoyl-CoA reductase [Corynebacterium pseudodiphtheriticum]UQV58660.1 NADPH-dependent 2,4-dienoyl-CoA reductase [Corynebacterium pseudodiphtheriticum]
MTHFASTPMASSVTNSAPRATPDSRNDNYSRLLAPLTVGKKRFRNRAIMGSMHTGLEDDPADAPKLAAYFAERAQGGAAAVVTGGYSPNQLGVLSPYAQPFNNHEMVQAHKQVTAAVHEHDSLAFLQLLHAGRYAFHMESVSASATQAPISPFPSRALSDEEVAQTVQDFAHSAKLAAEAGYDGVQIMGSEGYLINQFLSSRTNQRDDRWAQQRSLFALEVARAVRKAVPADFLVDFRMSMLELVDEGQTQTEILELARGLEEAGVDMLSTGIGWHEAQVPTVVTSVPRAAFSWATARVKKHVNIPVVSSNRINTPEVAEQVLAGTWDDTGVETDFVSMARPWLADPEFINRVQSGNARQINHCIACNQSCLDHVFENKRATCLVNPRAGYETELTLQPINKGNASAGEPAGSAHPENAAPKAAVIGGGVAGLFGAEALAKRGYSVEVFEAADTVGGQFRLAMQIPGKEEFHYSLQSVLARLDAHNVKITTSSPMTANEAFAAGFDEVVIATGVRPRIPEIPGIEQAMAGEFDVDVITYAELLSGAKQAGNKVAIAGAGGIGFDVAEYLVEAPASTNITAADITAEPTPATINEWESAWGVSRRSDLPGNLERPHPPRAQREITMLQRKPSPQGLGLNRTTGWVHRISVAAAGVKQVSGVAYTKVDNHGLHLNVPVNDATKTSKAIRKAQKAGDKAKVAELEDDLKNNRIDTVLDVDTIVLCTGQESVVEADFESLTEDQRSRVHVIGGADVAAELDAARAIRQAVELASELKR